MSLTPYKPETHLKTTSKRTGRRSCSRICRARRRLKNGGARSTCCSNSKVSAKLETLGSLIPALENNNGDQLRKSDLLFKETADYIVLLETQVLILQRLVEFYGSNERDQNAV